MEYTVLTMNIGGYERLHEISPEAYEQMKDHTEFIYVTDDHSITSNTWTVVYEDNLSGDNFNKCLQIRYNPFKYIHTDIVVKIDGSMGIMHSLDPIIKYFNEGKYDLAVMEHPTRMNLYDEYVAWVNQRGYSVKNANKVLSFLSQMEGYPVKENIGLYQYNFMIQRRDELNKTLNGLTYWMLKLLAGENETIHRVDQCVGSAIINKYFSNSKILPVGQFICDGSYFNWYIHNTDNAMTMNGSMCTPFLLGKQTDIPYII